MFEKIKKIAEIIIVIFFVIGIVYIIGMSIYYDPFIRWGVFGLIFIFALWVVWINYIRSEDTKLFRIVQVIFPVTIFSLLLEIITQSLYKFKKENFKDLYFHNGFIYHGKRIYTGHAFFEHDFSCMINTDFLKSNWGKDLDIYLNSNDKYDNSGVWKIEFKIFQGEIKVRKDYGMDKKIFKKIEFFNDVTNEQEITYYKKRISVNKKTFLDNGKEKEYIQEWLIDERIKNIYFDGKLESTEEF